MINIIKSNFTVFGLDIGFQTLKLVQIRKKRSGIYLTGAIEIPLQEKILDKDRFRNKADTANLIKDALKKAKPGAITARSIVSALPETFVFTKTVKMPKMSPAEYQAAIPHEIADFLPIPIENVYFDYQILVAHPDESLSDILIVATPKRLVDDYVEMANLAGLDLVALETKPMAVGRAIIGDKDKDGTLILHVGTEYSRIAIWDNGGLKLSTMVNTGQNQLLESLGMKGNPDKKVITLDATSKKDIAQPLNNIIEEAINAIKYHQNRGYKPQPIKKIVLCGSGVLISGIDTLIEDQVKIKTEIQKIKLAGNQELPPQYIAAYGLALRHESE
jgi:type IV pilus assembly protein PilM